MRRPNIFFIATKELSQDAFITWLILWADPRNAIFDPQLHRCGQAFVRSLLAKKVETIEKIEAGRQWNQVDVWALINDKYLVIIEDKTFSFEHSNQLAAYKNMAQAYCEEKNLELLCIYLKTGSESKVSLDKVASKGFSIYSRANLLELLDKFHDVKNDIFSDFRTRLMHIEESQLEYERKLLGDWNGDCWVGFYQYLEKNRVSCGWSFVSNPSGGFWNFILNWENWKGFPVYMQIQESKICYKISTHPEEILTKAAVDRSNVRNQWSSLILKQAEKMGYIEIRRPERFGSGNYMTVAQIDREHWLGPDDKFIDKSKVIELLSKYEEVLFNLVHTPGS